MSENRTASELAMRPWEVAEFPVVLRYRYRGSDTVWSMYFRTEAARAAFAATFSPFTTLVETEESTGECR